MAMNSIARPRETVGAANEPISWLVRHPLLAYFGLAYAITWTLWLAYYLSGAGLGLLPYTPPNLLVLFGQYGPSIAAFAVTAAIGGRGAVRGLWHRFGLWRVGVGWYPLVVLGPFFLLALALIARVGFGPLGAAGGDGPSILLEYLISALALKLVLGGALGEEAGWRGFALPRLQARHGALGASLILGALWAGWHAPLYLSPARAVQNPPLPFAIAILAMTIIYTWIYNRTGGSLPLALLLHAAINSAPPALHPLVPGLGAGEFFALYIAGYVAVALLLLVATRGRLGHRPDQPVPADSSPTPESPGSTG